MARRSAIVLAALLLLTGCSATVPQPSDRNSGLTVTPAPLPAMSNDTRSVERLAPGIGPTGIDNPVALAEAHERVFADRAYIRRANRTITTANGTVITDQSFITRVDSAHRIRYTLLRARGPQADFFGDDRSTEVWSIGTRQYQSIDGENGTSYRELPSWQSIQPSLIAPASSAVFLMGSVFETNVSRHRSGRAIVLTGHQLASPSLLSSAAGVAHPHNATLRAIVRPDGLVRFYSIQFSASTGNRPIAFSITVRYAGVGNHAVGPPPIPEALPN